MSKQRTSEANGRNRSKWTGQYEGWSRRKWLKIQGKVFGKYFQLDKLIDRRGYKSHFLHQIVATP